MAAGRPACPKYLSFKRILTNSRSPRFRINLHFGGDPYLLIGCGGRRRRRRRRREREREREEASDVFRVTMASATSGRTMNAKKQVTWAAPGTFAYAKAKRQRSFTPTYASKVLCQAANADEASNAAHILPRREVRTCFRSFTAFKHTQLTKTLFFHSPMLDEHLGFKNKIK